MNEREGREGTRDDLTRAAEALEGCGRYTMGTCGECGAEVRPMRWNCGNRVCPSCSYIRSQTIIKRLTPEIMDLMLWDEGPDNYQLQHLVLTTRKPEPPNQAYYRATLRSFLGGVGEGGILKALWCDFLKVPGSGAIMAVEVGQHGMVHAHVVYYGPVVSEEALAEWYKEQGHPYRVKCIPYESDPDDIETLVGYVSKEISHFDHLRPQVAAWVLAELHRTRRFRTYGKFYGLKVPPMEDEEDTICWSCGAMPCTLHIGRPMSYAEVQEWRAETGSSYLPDIA